MIKTNRQYFLMTNQKWVIIVFLKITNYIKASCYIIKNY